MNKRIKIILIVSSILILLGINSVYAASGSFSVNKTSATIEIGATTTFSITTTNCGGKFTITSSNTSVATVSSSGEWIENASKDITITAKAAGTATITIKADDVASTDEEEVTGSKTITVTVPEKKVETNTNTGTGSSSNGSTQTPSTSNESTATTPAKSPEARLNTFGITPSEYDFSGFSKNRDKENWSTTVPNSVTEVAVYATALSEKAKVEGTGKVTLNEGNNTVKVTVTAEAGNTKTYTLTIKRKTEAEEATENGEARLKNFGIKPEEYDFTGFDSEKTEYSVEVPNEVKEIEIYATAMNSSAQITGTGMIELDEGINELLIDVIAVNGTKKTYTLKVTRKESDEVEGTTEEQFGLSTLSISGLKLSPSFKVGTYEYTVMLEEDLATLEIKANANTEDATVEIIGNENLQEGENVITILVTNNETDEVATYQVIVNKNVTVEEIEQTSWLKPSTWGKEEKIKIAIIIVLIILIICAVILKIKISKESKNNREVDFPGADELDKAIAEHQELSEEEPVEKMLEIDYAEQTVKNEVEQQNYIEDIAKNKFGGMNDEVVEKPKRKGRHF